ncbi:MAG: hypothetical protein AABX13_02675 [Nanoarchaeota archaeon]
MKLYLTNAATVYLAAVMALCSEKGPSQEREEHGKRQIVPAVLKRDKSYLVLIDAYEEIKKLSQLVGFAGKYGHIEVLRNEHVYGCRPPSCSEISWPELEQRFPGKKFEVREVQISGDAEKALQWFKQNLEGRAYNLFYNNCTDAVVSMYGASGDGRRLLDPVEVEKTYSTNHPLREFMEKYQIPKPKRAEVFFPDQFTRLGTLVMKGTFARR